jgi:hypothetical protein
MPITNPVARTACDGSLRNYRAQCSRTVILILSFEGDEMKPEKLERLRPVRSDQPFLIVTMDHLQIGGGDRSTAVGFRCEVWKRG